jgi:hypothetical protein
MPYVTRVVDNNNTDPAGSLGHFLRNRCISHFLEYLGQKGLSFSYERCLAAVAIQPVDGRTTHVSWLGDRISLVYGNSGLYKGTDPDYNDFKDINADNVPVTQRNAIAQRGQHAEQTAVELVQDSGYNFYVLGGRRHIYVDYPPCETCGPWLAQRGDWVVHTWASALTEPEIQRVAQAKKEWRSLRHGRQFEP